MSIQWIIADVDGCLTPEESVPWDLASFAHFAQLAREASAGRGPTAPITLCTGRPQPYAEVLMKLLDVRAPAICENGAVLYTLHDNRARYAPGVTEERILDLRRVRAHIETELLPGCPEAVIQFGKEAQISVFSQRPDLLRAMQPEVVAFADRIGLALDVNLSHFYLNISLAGVDKGAALDALLVELGVGRDDVAGIGDTEGDLPLREAVGFFACPANATEAIRDAADYVSPHSTLDGVLDILARPEMKRA